MDQGLGSGSASYLPERPEPARIVQGLGWLSIALGTYELTCARRLVGLLGGRNAGTVRLYGVREIATGIALLQAPDPAPFVWARIAGDGLDLLSLVLGFRRSTRKTTRLLALLSVVGITALDVAAAQRID